MSQPSRRTTAHGNSDSAFRGAGAYPRELVPAARPGDYVRLEPDGTIYQIDVMVPQPGVLAFEAGNNEVSLAANDVERDVEAEELEMPSEWLGQYRPVHLGTDLPDDVEVQVDMGGRQAPLYTNKNFRGKIDQETSTEMGHDGSSAATGDAFNGHLTELYVHEDEVPYFTFDETGGSQATVSDLRFSGFQYRLVETGNPNGAHVEPLPTQRVRD